MYTYVNGFRFAGRDDGSDVMLHLMQEVPKYDEKSEIVGMDNEIVASIVMTQENALNLAIAIQKSLGKPTTD